MHIFFSAIGGTAIGPLALIAKQAGYTVSGSDKQDSQYIAYLKKQGITDIHIGQEHDQISAVHEKNPIDWYVYSSAVAIENPDAPEFVFCREQNIKMSKRDELLNHIIAEKNLELIAVAGTHGKTTTTAMTIWLFKKLGIPISYSVGAKISFGDMGHYEADSRYFIYEADEFDRNFLKFSPAISIITGIDYDHPDIYPSREDYYEAFSEFVGKSQHVVAHPEDLRRIDVPAIDETVSSEVFTLTGAVNRKNAQLVVQAVQDITQKPVNDLVTIMNRFPGVSRRFEKITDGLYSDYAHTPEKIRGALQMAHEIAQDKVIVVYEGLHNTRQHFIKEDLRTLFEGVKKLYIVPSYLAREDASLELLTPEKLCQITEFPHAREPAQLDERLHKSIAEHIQNGELVVCLSAGGGGSLDEWLRTKFQ